MKLQAQVSRAQLLRAWKAQRDTDSRVETAALFGYEASSRYLRRMQESAIEVILPALDENNTAPDGTLEAQTLQPPEPRPQVRYYYLAERQRYATEDQAKQETPPIFDGVTAISDDELEHCWDDEPQKPLPATPLTQSATLTPFVRKSLRQEVGRKLDVKTLVKQIARQQPLTALPTQPRLLPAGRVTLIADLNNRLLPFWDDIREACQLIKQKHGKIGLDMRVLARDEPLEDYYRFEDWVNRKLDAKPWQKIPAQSQVFIVSDLGQLAEPSSLIRQCWLHFIITLNRRGITPIVLAPIAAAKQCPTLQARTHQVLWQRFGQLTTQQIRGDKAQHQQRVEQVLAFLSLSPHIEPALLRALCELLPRQDGQSGIEADVYLHPDVQWGYTAISLRAERREHYQQQFAKESQRFKQHVLDCIGQHQAAQFAAVWAESILNAEKLMSVDSARVKKAEQLMLGLTKRYSDTPANDGMMRFARRHLSRINLQQHQAKDYLPFMYALANRPALEQGLTIPDVYADKTGFISQALRQPAQKRQYTLQQIGAQLHISQQAPACGQALATFSAVQKSIPINREYQQLPKNTASMPVMLAKQGETNRSLHIDTGQEHLTIRTLQKPSWASEITMVDGVPLATLVFAGDAYPLKPEWQNEQLTWQPTTETQQVVGFDEYGLFAEISVQDVTQRLRYIEPATFMMGSPEDEKGRDDDEDLHQVTLTQGYWLADTACTQAFWQAVTGKNPSEFKDNAQNPVENVNWLDAQGFIGKLQQLNPKLQAHLPTEAQWENACRAGTATPFSFEGEADLQKLNYSGLWGESGYHDKARRKTTTVKSYPANDWGLYEMHGNLWEWCFDEWQNNLGIEPATDPVTASDKPSGSDLSGALAATEKAEQSRAPYDSALLTNADDGGVRLVLRGGSCYGGSRYCRSAIRDGLPASYRDRGIGFRFAVGLELPDSAVLRSNTVDSKTGQPSEQTGQDMERRGAAQRVPKSVGCSRCHFFLR